MNHKYHVFVTEYLKWGNQVLAYRNAYKTNSSHKSVQSAANRLLNHPEVAKAISEAEARIRGEVEIAIANRQIKEVLTIEEKRSLLKQIATGSIYIEQKYKGKNCTQCSQYITSTIKEMLWAIREDSKTAGHYPYKLNGKWIIPAFPEEEVKTENLPVRTDVHPRPNDHSVGQAGGQQNTCPNDEIGRATTKQQDIMTEITLSPAGGGVSLSADGGGTREGQETSHENILENDNKIQQTEVLSPAGVSHPPQAEGSGGVACPEEFREGGTFAQDKNANTENDNNLQQTVENTIDNQSLTEDLGTHNTPLSRHSLSEGGSGRILTRAELKELLHPSTKPQLMPMVNEQHE